MNGPLYLCGSWSDGEAEAWQRALQQAMPQERVLTSLTEAERAEVEVALVANPPPGRLQGLPRLGLIQSLWAGVDRLLADPTRPAGVPLARMVDPAMNQAMAQTVLWAVLSLHRGHFAYARQQQRRHWAVLPQCPASACRVTVLGLGEMGGTAAALLAQVGYDVQGWRLGAGSRPAPAGVAVAQGLAALPALLARTDVVVNLLPLTPATRGLVDARFLALLPPGAALVNLARGGHVIESDLLAALDTGRLAHAVLDVFACEPLPPGHPLWVHPAVTVRPHAAALTDPGSASQVVARQVARWRAGEAVHHRVQAGHGY